MRNWNVVSSPVINQLVRVFTVPMRNWNMLTAQRYYKNDNGFYSTYEELKLNQWWICWIFCNQVFTVPMRNWNTVPEVPLCPTNPRFYSTYEELKHKIRNTIKNPFNCFYSTYEELKPGFENWKWINGYPVFTVPMRNWNFYNSIE